LELISTVTAEKQSDSERSGEAGAVDKCAIVVDENCRHTGRSFCLGRGLSLLDGAQLASRPSKVGVDK
jgi:hypothetical protein